MSKIAVIGSGPGAMYTIKYLIKHARSRVERVDIFEKLPIPYGLVNYGVAPDHVEVKEVSKEFDEFLRNHRQQVHLFLGQTIQGTREIKSLQSSYSATLIATGAQGAHRLPFTHLPQNTMSAQDFVYWYNGHPEQQRMSIPADSRNVSIVGHGNVALDVARVLSKSIEELEPLRKSGLLSVAAFEWLASRQAMQGPLSVSILGRRGYLDAAFTNKEFRELTTMKDATCRINPKELDADIASLREMTTGNRAKSRGLAILEKCINHYDDDSKKNSIFLRFFTKPFAYEGDPVTGLLVSNKEGKSEMIPTQLGIESIGMKVDSTQLGLPIDPRTGGILHDGFGRVTGFPRIYVAGWSKRGPRGVIAANVPCCMQTADAMVDDLSKMENGGSVETEEFKISPRATEYIP
jgi:hypothetical protein